MEKRSGGASAHGVSRLFSSQLCMALGYLACVYASSPLAEDSFVPLLCTRWSCVSHARRCSWPLASHAFLTNRSMASGGDQSLETRATHSGRMCSAGMRVHNYSLFHMTLHS